MKPWVALITTILTLAAGGCAVTPKADFVVTREPIGPPLVGFGACMNPYVYGPPNRPAEVNDQNVGTLESEVKALYPQFVRIFFLDSWWERDTDPVIAKDRPGMKESLIKTVRLAQEAGAQVLLQFWYDPKRYADADDVARRFAHIVAEMRNQHGLKAVRFVTMQNEPNDNGKDITSDQYVRLYRALDQAMRTEGIRDDVQIIGGDLVSVNQADWIAMLGRELSPVLDGYSIHAYWGYWDTAKLLRRIHETRQQVDSLPPEQRRPLYVTEFGVQGRRPKPNVEPGFYDDGRVVTEVPAACAQVAWFMMEALNNGFAGTIQWDMYDAWYDRKMGYGVIGPAEGHFQKRPGYDLLQIFTEGVEPGAKVLRIDGGIQTGVIVLAVKNPDGRIATFLLNVSQEERVVRVGQLGSRRGSQVTVWNAEGKGMTKKGGPVPEASGRTPIVTLRPDELVRVESRP